MANSTVFGDAAYTCDVCKRSIRVSRNIYGLDVIQRCIITQNCVGKLYPKKVPAQIAATPRIPPEVEGLQDWFQREILYDHYQTISTSEWLVEHNLGSLPLVQVEVERQTSTGTTMVELAPDSYTVIMIDANSLKIEFNVPEVGIAQCVATSSKNEVNPIIAPTVTLTDMLLTNLGLITIATLATASSIAVPLVYNNVGDVTINYGSVGTVPSLGSPWSGTNFVMIEGRKYATRSFNIRFDPPAPSYFDVGQIVSGASVYFNLSMIPRQNFILLGAAPWAPTDRITNQMIDLALVNRQSPELYFSAGNIFAKPSILKETYPPIFVVA